MQEATGVAKRDTAKQWANRVSFADGAKDEWRYLLVSETDIKQAKGSWSALKTAAA